jgi:hypothetical protein
LRLVSCLWVTHAHTHTHTHTQTHRHRQTHTRIPIIHTRAPVDNEKFILFPFSSLPSPPSSARSPPVTRPPFLMNRNRFRGITPSLSCTRTLHLSFLSDLGLSHAVRVSVCDDGLFDDDDDACLWGRARE